MVSWEALAAGVPVVATQFPHAAELLTAGRGLVVPHRDPRALAEAVHVALRGARTSPRPVDRGAAGDVSWPAVAARYHRLAAAIGHRAQFP
ncbi:glycosyltransferase [Streptomyces sp. NPDC007369]|uniref:glycosyltransferase n=1 Tax=Streptomyces sp. NPDC007369 TaxID=3154589 RepID=UPI0033CD0862